VVQSESFNENLPPRIFPCRDPRVFFAPPARSQVFFLVFSPSPTGRLLDFLFFFPFQRYDCPHNPVLFQIWRVSPCPDFLFCRGMNFYSSMGLSGCVFFLWKTDPTPFAFPFMTFTLFLFLPLAFCMSTLGPKELRFVYPPPPLYHPFVFFAQRFSPPPSSR